MYPDALVAAMACGIELAAWRHHRPGQVFLAPYGDSSDGLGNFPADEAAVPMEAGEDSGDEPETRPTPLPDRPLH